jgi:hypothetical protein
VLVIRNLGRQHLVVVDNVICPLLHRLGDGVGEHDAAVAADLASDSGDVQLAKNGNLNNKGFQGKVGILLDRGGFLLRPVFLILLLEAKFDHKDCPLHGEKLTSRGELDP